MAAGVARGIANRYAIDPVIVRVAFVVTAFYGGAGVLLYLAGWLLFPEQNDEESPFMAMVRQGRSSTGTFFTLLLCTAAIGVSFWTFNGDGAGLISLLLLIAGIYLLHRHRGGIVQQTPPPPMPAPPQVPVTAPVQNTQEVEDMASPVTDPEPPRDQPPAWDPLGAAPFAWDLPDPKPVPTDPEPVRPRRRAKVGGITLGAALVVGGACVLAAPYAPWLSVGHIIGVVLGVIGLGMTLGSLVGGGRGLIGLAVPLALVGFVFTNTGPGGGPRVIGEQWGDRNITVTSVEEVQTSYSVGGGSINLDLSALKSGSVHTNVSVGLGDATVIVPADATVNIRCEASRGSVDCLGDENNGIPASGYASRSGTGANISIDIRVSTGVVEVRRG